MNVVDYNQFHISLSLSYGCINVKLHDVNIKKSTYIVIKQTATVRELIHQAGKTLNQDINAMQISVHDQVLDFKSRATLEDNDIFNKTTVHVLVLEIAYAATGDALASHCEDCWMMIFCCPFIGHVQKWDMHELTKKHGNAYLILCQRFNLPSDVIEIIEDNHLDNGVRLDDALHRICHKNPNTTREEVIDIISNTTA